MDVKPPATGSVQVWKVWTPGGGTFSGGGGTLGMGGMADRAESLAHFHNSSLPTMSGHDVNTASSSASVASSRTSTATVDKTNFCFLELLLLSV